MHAHTNQIVSSPCNNCVKNSKEKQLICRRTRSVINVELLLFYLILRENIDQMGEPKKLVAKYKVDKLGFINQGS